MFKVESAMRIVLQFHEAFNRRDTAGMMGLMSDDCILVNTNPAPDGTVYSGKEAITRYYEDFFRNSAHAQVEIEEIFGLGERCVLRWIYHWENMEGKKLHLRGIDVFRVRSGSICEELSYAKGSTV